MWSRRDWITVILIWFRYIGKEKFCGRDMELYIREISIDCGFQVYGTDSVGNLAGKWWWSGA